MWGMVERQRFLEPRVFGRTQVLTGTMRTLPVRVGGVVGAHHTQFVCGAEQSRNLCVTPSDHRVTGVIKTDSLASGSEAGASLKRRGKSVIDGCNQ